MRACGVANATSFINAQEQRDMESTLGENGRTMRGDVKTLKSDAGALAQKLRSAGGQEVNNLVADVQELLGRVAHVADPEIARLRVKVEAAIATAKKAIGEGADQVQRQAQVAMKASDRYVREKPWQAVGIAALAGLAVGFLVSRR
jgi:ElaB/YqjD/DUF883 family membrane-anchored ribosome-binding protein